MLEPGLDRHEWESEWAVLEPLVEDEPAETLTEVGELVARMLPARGYALDDPVARAGDEREVAAEFLAARDAADAVRRGDAVDPGDVADAVNAYRSCTSSCSTTPAQRRRTREPRGRVAHTSVGLATQAQRSPHIRHACDTLGRPGPGSLLAGVPGTPWGRLGRHSRRYAC